jgi:membrane protease YdiL (CAAX protease family)
MSARISDWVSPVASLLYAIALVAFWSLAQHFSLSARIGHFPSTFTAFALIFAPFWFFGFGLADRLRSRLITRTARILTAALLIIPYLIYALPRGEFRWTVFLVFLAIPVGASALFQLLPPGGADPATPKICWQDVLILAVVGLPIEFNWFYGAFPHQGLNSLPKLLMVDAALYAFLVARPLENVGYDFRPRPRDLFIGLRELVLFAPIVITLGIALHFITPHGGLPRASTAASALLITFFFVAIPEELFFRGLLQNMLEARLGRARSLRIAAVIFGLSHFNKPGPFNWRYVLLATIAGIFYGRAWRDRQRLLTSSITHTLVDVLWTLWFR